MKSLRERWNDFFTVALDPWTAVLSVCVAILFAMSVATKEPLPSALLFVLITIASAILGGRVTHQWAQAHEGNVVVARGRAAVRSLKLLLGNVASLEARIRTFRDDTVQIEKHPEVTKRNYEEAIEICRVLQEEAVSSIENWTDIVPEADIKTQIGLITQLKQSMVKKEEELTRLNSALQETKGQTEQERMRLKKQIQEREQQIRELGLEVAKQRASVGLFGLGSLPPAPIYGSGISSQGLGLADTLKVGIGPRGLLEPDEKK